MLPLLRAPLGGRNNNAQAILLSPLLFGVAHLHHGWQRVAREGVPVRVLCLVCVCVWILDGQTGQGAARACACLVYVGMCPRWVDG